MVKHEIMPFHLYHHQGKPYVMNIERMQARSVDEKTAQVLKTIINEPALSLTFDMEKALEQYGLISKPGNKLTNSTQNNPIPVVRIALFLTQSCNLRCIYCYGDGGEYGSGGSMEVKTAFQAVDWLIEQAGKMKLVHIGFFGGEPFLEFPLMKAVVEYAKERANDAGKNVDFNVVTNATLLNDEMITFIKEQSISVMVSFDGLKEVQDSQRPFAHGKGSYDSTLPKIKKLLATVPKTHGHAVIVGNLDPQLVKNSLQKIGFAGVSISPASQSLFAGESDQRKLVRDSQTIFQSLEQEAETWLRLIQSRDFESIQNLKARSEIYGLYRGMVSLLHNSKRHHFCGAGRAMVGISVSGDVYLCHRFVGRDEYKLGSVFENKLNRDDYQKSSITDNEQCANCFAKYYCAGGCKHDNLGSCGSIAKPSLDMCRLRCRELELSIYIVSNLNSEDQAFLVEQGILPPKPCPLDF